MKPEPQAIESALRLEVADRRRLQVALTSLGFDTRGNDGVFGPRSRELAKFEADQASKPNVAAASPAAPASPPSDGMLEQKKITLPNRNGVGCNASVSCNIQIYARKVVLQIANDWQTLEAGATGDFGASFQSGVSEAKLSVSGNLPARTISVVNLASNGCTWEEL